MFSLLINLWLIAWVTIKRKFSTSRTPQRNVNRSARGSTMIFKVNGKFEFSDLVTAPPNGPCRFALRNPAFAFRPSMVSNEAG
jgi:hypothetical protein